MIFEDQVLFYKFSKVKEATGMYHIVGFKLDCSLLIHMVYLQCSKAFLRLFKFCVVYLPFEATGFVLT